jgi:hypothetical protein
MTPRSLRELDAKIAVTSGRSARIRSVATVGAFRRCGLTTAELKALVLARGSLLMDNHGAGPVVAPRILADVGGVARSPIDTGLGPVQG